MLWLWPMRQHFFAKNASIRLIARICFMPTIGKCWQPQQKWQNALQNCFDPKSVKHTISAESCRSATCVDYGKPICHIAWSAHTQAKWRNVAQYIGNARLVWPDANSWTFRNVSSFADLFLSLLHRCQSARIYDSPDKNPDKIVNSWLSNNIIGRLIFIETLCTLTCVKMKVSKANKLAVVLINVVCGVAMSMVKGNGKCQQGKSPTCATDAKIVRPYAVIEKLGLSSLSTSFVRACMRTCK